MSPTKPLPAALQRWAEQRIGPVVSVRDASHDWDRSRVWDLEGERGAHHYLKVSPSVKFFTRESRAYRHIVPALGHTRAPRLVDSRAQDLALLLTAVPGAPVKELGLGAVEWRTVHEQAGALCARLHEAGPLDRGDRAEAEASMSAAADGAEKYLARAGDRLNQDEQQLIRDHAARLRRVGPVLVGYIHGDNRAVHQASQLSEPLLSDGCPLQVVRVRGAPRPMGHPLRRSASRQPVPPNGSGTWSNKPSPPSSSGDSSPRSAARRPGSPPSSRSSSPSIWPAQAEDGKGSVTPKRTHGVTANDRSRPAGESGETLSPHGG